MAAVVEEKKKRAPYKTKKWWAVYDAEMSKKFPVGSMPKIHRGRDIVQVRVLTRCSHGRIEVYNILTGKQYRANVDAMIPLDTKSPDEMAASVAAERAQRAQEPHRSQSRPDIVRLFLRPIQEPDRRLGELTFRDRAKLLPLSSDELVAYTAMQAIIKTLATLHSNQDSFRNPELFSLIDSARILLQTCTKEMEQYTELPEEA